METGNYFILTAIPLVDEFLIQTQRSAITVPISLRPGATNISRTRSTESDEVPYSPNIPDLESNRYVV